MILIVICDAAQGNLKKTNAYNIIHKPLNFSFGILVLRKLKFIAMIQAYLKNTSFMIYHKNYLSIIIGGQH